MREKVVVAEFCRRLVAQCELRGAQHQPTLFVRCRVSGNWQAAIDENQRRVILEVRVNGPLHADEARSQHREARRPFDDDGPGVGDRIPHLLRRRRQCNRQEEQCQQDDSSHPATISRSRCVPRFRSPTLSASMLIALGIVLGAVAIIRLRT